MKYKNNNPRRGKLLYGNPENFGDLWDLEVDASYGQGIACCGLLIRDPAHNIWKHQARIEEVKDSGIAEAAAICYALQVAREYGIDHVKLLTDSHQTYMALARETTAGISGRLSPRGVKGARKHILPWVNRIEASYSDFQEVRIVWASRHFNQEADALAHSYLSLLRLSEGGPAGALNGPL